MNIQQMVDLLRVSPTTDMEVVIHQHLPMFHTEHCVYCTFLSEGTDYTNCGRPCEQHRASLQDRIGMSHRSGSMKAAATRCTTRSNSPARSI
ncbi:hypothetical protein HMSSN036_53850 [Paenibacillus macerans]|nr:hypothetical protein HMSSN036_53850 [Paenibacillus macerans]